MRLRFAPVALGLLAALGAAAATTNEFSDAVIQGRNLAQQLCAVRPAENSTNTGVLQIRDGKGKRSESPVSCRAVVTATNWLSVYETGATNRAVTLWVVHTANQSNEYFYRTNAADQVPVPGSIPALGHLLRNPPLSDAELMTPFAGSDFWVADLGLEFFHWPQQKVLKKEVHRSCGCTVLESVNPNQSTNGYSRVVSWIDTESLGIVEAYAYDAKGNKLKNFYPKNLKKVNGQYQVETMILDNMQTGSRTRLEFDLDKK